MGRVFKAVVKVVVAAIIVLFVWAILLPTIFPLDCCRNQSNESAAVANLRTINTAEVTYLSSSDGKYGTMKDLIDAKLLDDTFTSSKAGYNYSIMLDATATRYTAEATPASENTGRYGYYSYGVPSHAAENAYELQVLIHYSTNPSLAPARLSGKPVQ